MILLVTFSFYIVKLSDPFKWLVTFNFQLEDEKVTLNQLVGFIFHFFKGFPCHVFARNSDGALLTEGLIMTSNQSNIRDTQATPPQK